MITRMSWVSDGQCRNKVVPLIIDEDGYKEIKQTPILQLKPRQPLLYGFILRHVRIGKSERRDTASSFYEAFNTAYSHIFVLHRTFRWIHKNVMRFCPN